MNKYLVFGGSGSLGNCLIKHLIEKNIVIISSRDEEKQWRIKNRYLNNKNINFHIGDIRDVDSVKSIIENSNPTHIIIASALKQIDICEKQPEESIMTNIIGIKNIVNIVKKMNNIKTLFVSTDKACSPVNVYGMCKSISEKIVTNQWDNQNNNCFVCVRYGNVLESRGSIIPLLRYQAINNDYFTITDVNMTRFLMTLNESCKLIEHAFEQKDNNGKTFIPILPAMRIMDLFEIFAEKYNKKIKTLGIRPGEKVYEELVNDSEIYRTIKNNNHYVINNSHQGINNDNTSIIKRYTSKSDVLSKKELKEYLEYLGIEL
jgi:FlaA1/EpsC-like NDP-sugar epimerase